MSEENLNNPNPVEPEVPVNTTPAADTPTEGVAPVEPAVAEPAPQATTQAQVIVQQERGFAHYVGFALLCVLCIAFFFIPGIALTFAVSLIPGISLGAIAAPF